MMEQVGHRESGKASKNTSLLACIQAGNRLYHQHLQPDNHANHLEEALNQYARALEQQPDCTEALCRMSKIFLRLGQYDKAERYAKKSLQAPEQKATGKKTQRFILQEAHYVLGVIQYRKGDLLAAKRSFKKSIVADMLRGSQARFSLFQTCRDLAFQNPLKPQMPILAFEAGYALISSLLLLPFFPERIAFGVLLLLIPQLTQAWLQEELGLESKALDRYLDIHRHYPGLGSVGIVIGSLYHQMRQPEKARYWFERVLAKHPGSLEAYYHLAKLMEEQEDYPAMAEIYEKLLRLRPRDPHVHCNLANAYYYMQGYQEALTYYESALQLSSDSRWKAMVAQSIANIHCDYLQNTQTAIAYYQMARDLDPNEIENYIQLGMLYFQKEDYINAELIYRKAIAIAPRNPRLYSNLGYLRWLENDVENAIAYYEKAISLDCGYEIPINNLGVIYLDMLGQVHKAIELFQQAIDIDQNYALAYYNLGRAYSFLDNRLEAAHCFRMAQDLNHYACELDNDELADRISQLFDTCEMELRDSQQL